MIFPRDATPVVVLGSHTRAALGILRSLGRLGVPVYTIDSDLRVPASASRYCLKAWRCDAQYFTDECLNDLLDIGSEIGQRSILIPTTDQGAIFVADRAGDLDEWFAIPTTNADLTRSLCSKKQLYNIAKKHRVPTPNAVFPTCKEDVRNFVESTSFPVIVKAIYNWLPLQRRVRSLAIANTRKELIERYDAMEESEEANVMLQEYIPGNDSTVWMFNGYFNEKSECLFGLTGRKIRTWPIHRGVTTLGICTKNETVEKTSEEFMKALRYKGMVDIGYRYDARDRLYKILDVNPRIGATFRLFVKEDGMDVMRACYFYMTRQSAPAARDLDGRKWCADDLDLGSSIFYFLEGNLALKDWINSYRGVSEAAYFAFDDPLPFVRMLARQVTEFRSTVNAIQMVKRTQ
jgi:D-aspartate ligase